MLKIGVSVVLAFAIGAGCRFFDIPVPAPPKLLGGLLIIAITVGYMTATDFCPNRTRRATLRSNRNNSPRLNKQRCAIFGRRMLILIETRSN